MPQDPRYVAPLNWERLVEETLRRRKAEGMTQREHAALANVSAPTMAAFERGEVTLTLAKALDILRVVGLVAQPSEEGVQDAFAREAYTRWRTLTSKLPEDSAARFPHGWYRIDYWLEGELRDVGLETFRGILEKAVVRKTGWPPFWLPTRKEIAPYELDGTIECWLSPETGGLERMFQDPAHCDFWRGAPSGRMFLLRGYQEDGQDTFPPGTIMDTTLPIWRMGETLLHAENLASLLRSGGASPATIHFRAIYSGISGRVLRNWANPLTGFLAEGHGARSDEAVLEAKFPAEDMKARLAERLFPLVTSLYERFGVTGLPEKLVATEIERMLASKAAR